MNKLSFGCIADLLVGTGRCAVPARVQQAERMDRLCARFIRHVPRLNGAVTAQRAVPTNFGFRDKLSFGCIAVYFAAASWAFGDSLSFEFTVAAGRYERNNVPVRVPMPRGQIGKERIASATLAGTD